MGFSQTGEKPVNYKKHGNDQTSKLFSYLKLMKARQSISTAAIDLPRVIFPE